jgi:predicted RNA-binding protein YlxR (DUF448 family)
MDEDDAPKGGQRGIYVRGSDVELWQRAEQFAKSRRLTMSATIMMALERLLDQEGSA